MSAYFGRPWGVPALEGAAWIPTPTGAACLHCGEAIAGDDRGWLCAVVAVVDGEPLGSDAYVHAECDLIGTLGHVFGVCSCTGYDTSKRDTGRELWRRAISGSSAPATGEGPR